jgi:autotransporter-associated beta strand protein
VIAGINTYTGATNVSAGTLKLASPIVPTSTDIIPNSSALTVAAGATLDLNGVAETVASLSGAATSTVLNSNTATAVSLVLAAASGTATFNGSILTGGTNGALSLSKTGASTLILNNPTPTYGASATIGAGTLQMGNGTIVLTSLPSAPITNNGTLIINQPSGTISSSAIISGAGGLTVSGAHTLNLSGANTFTGAISISGVSTVNASGTALGAGTVTVAANGTLNASANLALGGLAGAGKVNTSTFGLTVGGNNASTAFTGTLSGGVGGGLTKVGTGALTLSTNTYTGPTVINAGSLVATNNSSLGGGTDPITVNAGGALALTSGGTYAFTKPLTIAGAACAALGQSGGLGISMPGGGAKGHDHGALWVAPPPDAGDPRLAEVLFLGRGRVERESRRQRVCHRVEKGGEKKTSPLQEELSTKPK